MLILVFNHVNQGIEIFFAVWEHNYDIFFFSARFDV